eukprot:572227-Amphidinium_carterae.2
MSQPVWRYADDLMSPKSFINTSTLPSASGQTLRKNSRATTTSLRARCKRCTLIASKHAYESCPRSGQTNSRASDTSVIATRVARKWQRGFFGQGASWEDDILCGLDYTCRQDS